MKKFFALAVLALAAGAQAETSLQAECLRLVKPTMLPGEVLREIGGDGVRNVTFALAGEGGSVTVIDCVVRMDGSIILVTQGIIKKLS